MDDEQVGAERVYKSLGLLCSPSFVTARPDPSCSTGCSRVPPPTSGCTVCAEQYAPYLKSIFPLDYCCLCQKLLLMPDIIVCDEYLPFVSDIAVCIGQYCLYRKPLSVTYRMYVLASSPSFLSRQWAGAHGGGKCAGRIPSGSSDILGVENSQRQHGGKAKRGVHRWGSRPRVSVRSLLARSLARSESTRIGTPVLFFLFLIYFFSATNFVIYIQLGFVFMVKVRF